MRILREDIEVPHRVLLQLNSDEEVGKRILPCADRKEALRSFAVLVMEPGRV